MRSFFLCLRFSWKGNGQWSTFVVGRFVCFFAFVVLLVCPFGVAHKSDSSIKVGVTSP